VKPGISITVWAFSLLILPFHGVCRGSDARLLENRDISIRYEAPLENPAKEIVALLPRVRAELENSLSLPMAVRPVVLLLKDKAAFQEIVHSPLAAAIAIPRRQLIIIDYSSMHLQPFTLETTFKHELCHLVLQHHIDEEKLPRWLDEGVCQWVTGGMAEIVMGDSGSVLKRASLSRGLIPLSALTKSFPQEEGPLLLAYAESKSFIEFLATTFGPEAIPRIFGNLRRAGTIDQAFVTSLSLTPGELEARWRRSLEERITWFQYISANVYGILFFVAALLTVYGFIRIARRRRARIGGAEQDDDHVGEGFRQ
jgi:hypothetical protein